MDEQRTQVAFKRRHVLALRGIALIVALIVPVFLYAAANAGSQLLLWALMGIMIAAMGLAAWV